MDTLVESEKAISRLPEDQLYELAAKLDRRAGDAWDAQFESDVLNGRLHTAAQAALSEHRAGKSRPFPEDGK